MSPFLLLSLLSIVVIVTLCWLIPNAFANEHKFWNRVHENEIVFVKKEGKVVLGFCGVPGVRFAGAIPGHRQPNKLLKGADPCGYYALVPDSTHQGDQGLHWIGIFPRYQVHSHVFAWSKFAQEKDKPVEVVVARQEEVFSMYHRSTYAIVVEGRTNDNMPGQSILQVEIETIRPYVALFVIRKWLDVTKMYIESRVNKVIGRINFDAITSARWKRTYEQELVSSILALNDDIGFDPNNVRTLIDEVGVRIRNVSWSQFVPTPGQKLEEIYLLDARGTAEAKNLKRLVKSGGGTPEQVLDYLKNRELADALKNTKASTIVVGSSGIGVNVGGGGSKKP